MLQTTKYRFATEQQLPIDIIFSGTITSLMILSIAIWGHIIMLLSSQSIHNLVRSMIRRRDEAKTEIITGFQSATSSPRTSSWVSTWRAQTKTTANGPMQWSHERKLIGRALLNGAIALPRWPHTQVLCLKKDKYFFMKCNTPIQTNSQYQN